MKKLSINAITEIAVFGALAFVLDLAQGGIWKGVFPNGGSVGFAMIPIFIVCLRRGAFCGILTGFVVGLLQMLGGVYAIAGTWYNVFFQVALDYWIAYTLCGFAGCFKGLVDKASTPCKKAVFASLACVVGGLLKFLSHFLSGAIFFKNFDFPGGPTLYSIVYNGGYMLPNIIICTIVVVLLILKTPEAVYYRLNKEAK